MSDSSPTSISSLRRAQLLPAAAERAWIRDLLRFQVADLNALYDGLSAREEEDARDERAAERRVFEDSARTRIERLRAAARWLPPGCVDECWAMARTEIEFPEDAFGFAVYLLAARPDAPEVRSWARALHPQVIALLERLQLYTP